MLIEYPEVNRRLREEIVSRIGTKSQPSYGDIQTMKYLRAFLNGACGRPFDWLGGLTKVERGFEALSASVSVSGLTLSISNCSRKLAL